MAKTPKRPRPRRRRLVERLAEAKEELFNLRFQHVTGQLDNTTRLGRCAARTSPGSTPSSAPREIAAAEALRPRRPLMAETNDTTTAHRREPPARSARASSSSHEDGQDRRRHRDRPRAATRCTARRCSAPRSSTCTTRPTTPSVGDRVRVPRPARCRSSSAGASSRSWSGPDDPAGVPAPGRRQQRRQGGALHQGARRLRSAATRRSATSSSPPSRTPSPARRSRRATSSSASSSA